MTQFWHPTGDGDALGAVRLAIRQALAADLALQAEVQAILATAPGITQQIHAGRDAYTAGRDQTIVTCWRDGE
jgi:hypothetical protein